MSADVITMGVGPLGYVLGTAEAEAADERSPQVTPQQIKAQFRERGESVGQWADAHGFPRDVVYRVLNQRSPAWRGKTHEVAVALGLKPNPAKTSA